MINMIVIKQLHHVDHIIVSEFLSCTGYYGVLTLIVRSFIVRL